MKDRALWFTGPRAVDVRDLVLADPQAGEARVRVAASAISPGTEMLVYRGEFPAELALDATLGAFGGGFRYPVRYGYACVGRVEALGPGVEAGWVGRRVFAFQPHASAYVAPVTDLLPIPDDVSDDDALFLANMETAVNFLLDGAPLIGERVAVFGQGVVGLLTLGLLADLPLAACVAVDRWPVRRAAAVRLGATEALDPADAGTAARLRAVCGATDDADPAGFDLIYELSGAPPALDQAIAAAAFDGRIVVGSWYGAKRVSLDLGRRFHRGRVRLISSQVSTLTPALAGRWTKARRLEVAWRRLAALRPAQLITHRVPLEQAADAYRRIDAEPETCLQVILIPEGEA